MPTYYPNRQLKHQKFRLALTEDNLINQRESTQADILLQSERQLR